MRKTKAFTLIEVMISIFIFTTAMLGYMSFHAHSMSVLFDNESAQFAHSLAFNLIEELNAMNAKDFKAVVEAIGEGGTATDTLLSNYLGNTYHTSPFNLVKFEGSSGAYQFYRVIEVTKYATATHTSVPENSFKSTLYEVNVSVHWPKHGQGAENCETYNETKCNRISIPLVRPNQNTYKR